MRESRRELGHVVPEGHRSIWIALSKIESHWRTLYMKKDKLLFNVLTHSL